jgi:uncharacterized protein involved in tolerance to divalent cations
MANQVLLDACREQFAVDNGFAHVAADEQFEYFCALQLTKKSETTFTEIEDAITDGGNDGGIDCFLILVNDQCVTTSEDLEEIKITSTSSVQILVIQSKTTPSFREATFNNWITSWPVICDLSKNVNSLLKIFNSNLVEKIQLFRSIWIESIKKHAPLSIDFYYCTRAETANVNTVIDAKKIQFLSLAESLVKKCPISVNLLSSAELMNLYQQQPTQSLELVFEMDPTSISLTKEKYGYVGVVRLWHYLNFISDPSTGRVRESIFESNIRHFLGEVDVNKKIGETICSDKDNDFWWFNNGITIIAEKVAQLPKALHLENVAVINGLQTSFSIFEHRSTITEDDTRTVLVKVIRSTDKAVVDKIINASNFQNPVQPVLLRATDPVQRDIEDYCLIQGYFYDRRKGYYRNQGKPLNRIFTIQDMAQAIRSILFFDPATARRNPTTIIENDTTYSTIFDATKPFSSYLKSVLIVQKVRSFVSSTVTPEERGLAKNLTFHIARTATAELIGSKKYTHTDLESINVENLNDEILISSFIKTKIILENYAKESGENIINIIKSQKFSDYLTDNL